MKYVKYINEYTVEPAPKEIVANGKKYVGFSNAFLLARGYKPLRIEYLEDSSIYNETTDRTDNKYVPYYIEKDTEIVQTWTMVQSS